MSQLDDGESPLPVFHKTTGMASNRIVQDDDDEDEDLPAWAKSYQSPYKGGYKPPLPSSSDDDAVDLTKDSQQQPITPAPQDSQDDVPLAKWGQPPATEQNNNTVQPGSQTTPIKTPRGRKKATAAGLSNPLPVTKNTNVGKHQPKDPAPHDQKPSWPLQPTQQDTQQLIEEGDKQQEAALNVPDTQETLAEDTKKAAGRPPGSSKLPAPGSELPIMLPDKLPRNKVLVELSSRSHEDTVDLTGDSGAVGRIVVEPLQPQAGGSSKSQSQQQQQQLVVDLKGVIFRADALRLQGTALLLNIQPSEARVEAVLNDFLQLTDQGAGGFDDEGLGGGGIAGLLGDDDEDHYVMTQQGGDPMDLDGEDSDGARKKKKQKKTDGTKQSKKSASKTSSSRAKAGSGGKGMGVKGGVKKKKPAAGGKKPAAKPKAKK